MFYLEKCSIEGCTRNGNVAQEDGDIVCNIHKGEASNPEDVKKNDEINENEDEDN